MTVGVPQETKDSERRVGVTPQGAARLVAAGHEVLVERGAGSGCGFDDADYRQAGARLVDTATAWNVELVVKVKEPLEPEYRYFNGQMVFTYLHLAGAPPALTEALLASGTTAIAYETIEDERGALPLLAPMSAVAGSMAPLVGAYFLGGPQGGRGTLLGTILGKPQGRAVIIGDGIVGRHALDVASALGAQVEIFGITPENAASLEASGPQVRYRASTPEALSAALPEADLVVGAVLQRGAVAPHVVTEAMVRSMAPGSVIVDVSIDQGGCIATSRPTTHSQPVFTAHGVLHYCVTNMPGAYPRTSTIALTDASLPYVLRLATDGIDALLADARFACGLNTYAGYVTYRAVAQSLGLTDRYRDIDALRQ